MKKITKINGVDVNYIARNQCCNYNTALTDTQLEATKQQCIDKLGQLEDIEEELGIDLITLFKALKNGIWIREGYCGTCYLEGEPVFISSYNLHLNLYKYYSEKKNKHSCGESKPQESLCLFDMCYEDVNNIARVKDYGKTWALTKEELEENGIYKNRQ